MRRSSRINVKSKEEDDSQPIDENVARKRKRVNKKLLVKEHLRVEPQEDVQSERKRINKKLLKERVTKQKHDKPAKEIQENSEEEESQNIDKDTPTKRKRDNKKKKQNEEEPSRKKTRRR
ncbi:ABC transporter F family member 4-like [Papaver somniferum]|uniref:ABC transporter F family member 4-like n=1 Tax=Papaver somniferum TaxID=3469 RepID=UPI000E6F63D4|nr:ABC transporter F family member 4-like [Papaver somniferum]